MLTNGSMGSLNLYPRANEPCKQIFRKIKEKIDWATGFPPRSSTARIYRSSSPLHHHPGKSVRKREDWVRTDPMAEPGSDASALTAWLLPGYEDYMAIFCDC